MAALLEKPAFLVIIVLVLLLFGAKRLPELARGLGRSARIFKSETAELRSDSAPSEPAIVLAAPDAAADDITTR